MSAVAASGSALSRRVSEVVGVGLFAAALIWLVALASYDANDPAWFFSTGSDGLPTNFAGRVGAFLAELSFQLLGYASFLLPAMIAVVGWRYFWCRPVTAVYTKLTGATLLLGCAAAFLGIAIGRVDVGTRAYRSGGYVGEWVGGLMADYLSRTGSVIVLLAVMAGAVILATQFSFGHMFALLFSGMAGSVRRAIHRWDRANSVCGCAVFLASPRFRTLTCPNWHLITRSVCTTPARMRALTCSNWSMMVPIGVPLSSTLRFSGRIAKCQLTLMPCVSLRLLTAG